MGKGDKTPVQPREILGPVLWEKLEPDQATLQDGERIHSLPGAAHLPSVVLDEKINWDRQVEAVVAKSRRVARQGGSKNNV